MWDFHLTSSSLPILPLAFSFLPSLLLAAIVCPVCAGISLVSIVAPLPLVNEKGKSKIRSNIQSQKTQNTSFLIHELKKKSIALIIDKIWLNYLAFLWKKRKLLWSQSILLIVFLILHSLLLVYLYLTKINIHVIIWEVSVKWVKRYSS